MLRYHLKKLAPLLIGVAAVLLILGVVAAIALSRSSSTITPLGNASASRPATAQPRILQSATGVAPAAPDTTQPSPAEISADAPATGSAGDAAATTASANGNASSGGAGWSSGASSAAPNGSRTPPRTYSTDEQQTRQQAILAAYNCARQARQLPPLTLDPALSRKAEASWTALYNGTRRLESLGQSYPLFNLVAFDDALPVQGCTFGGFDATIAPALEQAHTIGIAAFPSQDNEGQDSPSALIIGK